MPLRTFAPILASLLLPVAGMAAQSCDTLMTVELEDVEIIASTEYGPGRLQLESDRRGAEATNAVLRTLPGLCRVTAIAKPTNESEIGIEVWLPADGGGPRLLDRDQLDAALEAGWIDGDTGRRALAEADRILRACQTGAWPPPVAKEWTRERARGALQRPR